MEIIEAAGLKILIDSMPVKSGQAWRSVMDPGIWMGAIAAGHVEVEQDQLGRRVWQRDKQLSSTAKRLLRPTIALS